MYNGTIVQLGDTPLHNTAWRNGKKACVELLLSHGADVHAEDEASK